MNTSLVLARIVSTLAPAPAPSSTPPVPSAPPLPGPSQWLLDTATAAGGWCRDRPWLALVGLLIAAGGYAARTVVARRRNARMTRHAQLITISPPPEVDPDGAATFWATLAEILHTGWRRSLRDGRARLAVEYRWSGRELTIAVWAPATIAHGSIQAAIRGAWPGAACTITDADPSLPLDALDVGGALAPTLPAWYPLQTDHDNDPVRSSVSASSRRRTRCSGLRCRRPRPRSVRPRRRPPRGRDAAAAHSRTVSCGSVTPVPRHPRQARTALARFDARGSSGRKFQRFVT
ncbi:hypothetical protein [Plantactinospora sp. CA-290183]|uniref:hypothetical protein n=1 Tax=Plantactinospora sp. CA-290183 TaxID=3240006 RepID=UPI003D8B7DD0